jgi:hypothetical protein
MINFPLQFRDLRRATGKQCGLQYFCVFKTIELRKVEKEGENWKIKVAEMKSNMGPMGV